MYQNPKGGFSLIELSIVLVIMGLLIAGISSGASLIKNAELRSVMAQAEGIRVSVNSYYLERVALPGDDSEVGTLDGDGDGAIQFVNSATPGVAEGINAWTHMAKFEIVMANYDASTVAADTDDVSKHVMTAKKAGGYWVFGSTNEGSFVYLVSGEAVAKKKPVVTDADKQSEPDPKWGIMSYADAIAFDKRYDDGQADTGAIRVATQDATSGFSLVSFSVDI